MKSVCLLLALIAVLLFASAQQQSNPTPSEWKSVEDALGRKGSMQPGDVYKFSMPRSDLKVTVAGTPIKAGLALGSWLAFKRMGNDAVAMGDLVLTESEVEPVMAKLQEEGVEQTAVHNHLLNETPRVMYMHVAGHGDAVKLATALKDALALTKTPAASPAPPAQQQNLGLQSLRRPPLDKRRLLFVKETLQGFQFIALVVSPGLEVRGSQLEDFETEVFRRLICVKRRLHIGLHLLDCPSDALLTDLGNGCKTCLFSCRS